MADANIQKHCKIRLDFISKEVFLSLLTAVLCLEVSHCNHKT